MAGSRPAARMGHMTAPPDIAGDPALQADVPSWETIRAHQLGQRYGCVVIPGPAGWEAKRGRGNGVETFPPRPALSADVLECHLHDRWFREATKSA
jgi:hypothetical protein